MYGEFIKTIELYCEDSILCIYMLFRLRRTSLLNQLGSNQTELPYSRTDTAYPSLLLSQLVVLYQSSSTITSIITALALAHSVAKAYAVALQLTQLQLIEVQLVQLIQQQYNYNNYN